MADSQEPSSTSSSSGPTTSGSSQSVPSSMDSGGTMSTLQTQDVVDGLVSDDEPESKCWGRLFPLNPNFDLTELHDNEYSFGRGPKNDCPFLQSRFKKKGKADFQALSTNHFKIYKEPSSNTAFITDLSSNGTFLNGEKIGKAKTHALNNNDEIALSRKSHKAFLFQDCVLASEQQNSIPEELREKYTVSKTIGRGACGEVKLAFKKGSTCDRFAIKIITKKNFSVGPKQAALKDEVKILKKLKHPCVIEIEDVIETEDMLYIILELVEGGELFDRVVSVTRFEEQTAKLLFYQMLEAVKYLHDQGITHRDLKPENVLLASEKNQTLIKVTDFGLSKMVGEQSLMKTLCGTPSYLAPEVLLSAGSGGYDMAVDCWSLGVILFICLAGYPPFSEELTKYTLNEQIIKGIYSFPAKFWKTVSQEAIDLVKKLLTVDPKKRLSVAEALEHPWLQDEQVIARANELMYPTEGEMPPPTQPVTKKRPAPEDGESSNEVNRKKTIPSDERESTDSNQSK